MGAQPTLIDVVPLLEDLVEGVAEVEAIVLTVQEDGHTRGLDLVRVRDRPDDAEDLTPDREVDLDLDPTKADRGLDHHPIPAQVVVNIIVEAQPHRVKEAVARKEAVGEVAEAREAVVRAETTGRVVLGAVVLVRPVAVKVAAEAAKDEAVDRLVVEAVPEVVAAVV